MTKWPWLMITLALISMVQRINSVAQKNTPKNAPVTTTTPRDIEYQSGYHTNVKNEYSANDSNTQINNSKKSLPNKSSSIITFPNSFDVKKGSGNTYQYKQFIPDKHVIEKCSKNESFCVEVDNYPRQDVLRILRTSKYMSSTFFGVDTINDLETRFSTDNLQSFCESKEEIIFPTASENINNEWRFIVQDNNENSIYKQGIRVEKCVDNGSCRFGDHVPIGYKTSCVQKFMFKKLVAVKETNEIYYDNFKLPSCCMCMYKADSELLLTRKGGLAEDQRTNQYGHDIKKN